MEDNNRYFKGIFSGACGGAIIATWGQPIDNIKFRMQLLHNGTMTSCGKEILKTEGIVGLYRGLPSSLWGQGLFCSILFFGQTQTRELLKDENNKNKIWHYFVAGAIGWSLGSIVEAPFDVIRVQLQTSKMQHLENKRYKCSSSYVKYLYQNKKLHTLYMGYCSHLLRNIPAGALHLGIYDTLRDLRASQLNISTRNLTTAELMIMGAISGGIFWTVIYPLDVIKSNLQGDNIHNRKYNGIYDCAKKIYLGFGLKGFYVGLIPCIARAIPANALMLYTVSKIYDYLN